MPEGRLKSEDSDIGTDEDDEAVSIEHIAPRGVKLAGDAARINGITAKASETGASFLW